MDEQREARDELAADDRDVADELREQETTRNFWILTEPFDAVGSGYAADDPKHPDAGRWA